MTASVVRFKADSSAALLARSSDVGSTFAVRGLASSSELKSSRSGGAPRRRTTSFNFDDVADVGGSLEESGAHRLNSSPRRSVSDVRQEAARRKTIVLGAKLELAEKSMRRHEAAERNRGVEETEKQQKCACKWFSICCATAIAIRARHALRISKATEKLTRCLVPLLIMKLHHIKRRKLKAALLRSLAAEPALTVDMLDRDSMLSLFGRPHLQNCIPSAELLFFLEGYNLMYEGEEGQDCYVLVHGQLELLAKGPQDDDGERPLVSLGFVTPPFVVGSIGMISGEPRTARVRCVTDVLVYCISRKYFLKSAPAPHVMEAALKQVTRLHESNIPQLYREVIGGELMQRFLMFQNAPETLLDELVPHYRPRVLHRGDILAHAGERCSKLSVILRGTIEFVKVSTSHIRPGALAEAVANQSDLIVVAGKEDARHLCYEPFLRVAAAGDGVMREGQNIVAEIPARCMVGGPAFILGNVFELSVVAASNVDVLEIDRDAFLRIAIRDPGALHAIRTAVNDFSAQWFKPLTRHQLLTTLFQDTAPFVLGLAAMRYHLVSHHHNPKQLPFDLVPVLIPQGSIVTFDERVALIVVDGSLELTAPGTKLPMLWPPLPNVYFGAYNVARRVTRNLEAWKLPRRTLLMFLQATLNDDARQQFSDAMRKAYEQRAGRAPTFEEVPGVNMPSVHGHAAVAAAASHLASRAAPQSGLPSRSAAQPLPVAAGDAAVPRGKSPPLQASLPGDPSELRVPPQQVLPQQGPLLEVPAGRFGGGSRRASVMFVDSTSPTVPFALADDADDDNRVDDVDDAAPLPPPRLVNLFPDGYQRFNARRPMDDAIREAIVKQRGDLRRQSSRAHSPLTDRGRGLTPPSPQPPVGASTPMEGTSPSRLSPVLIDETAKWPFVAPSVTPRPPQRDAPAAARDPIRMLFGDAAGVDELGELLLKSPVTASAAGRHAKRGGVGASCVLPHRMGRLPALTPRGPSQPHAAAGVPSPLSARQRLLQGAQLPKQRQRATQH